MTECAFALQLWLWNALSLWGPGMAFPLTLTTDLYVCFAVNKRRRSEAPVSKTIDDDEPPELSRCPSPVDESGYPQLISVLPLSAKVDYREAHTSDPPSLTLSMPEDSLAANDAGKLGENLPLLQTLGIAERDASDPRDFVMTRSSVRRVGSPDDTLDSMSSSESSANCDCLMPTLIADYDSSYGSACGRTAGAAVSDSEATAGSETETEKNDKMPILKNCDVC